ncbi:MAG: selenocysteine synthase [Bacteroidales bacterium]|nr:selenocysteine synthase [Bacteroidales bacterium]
MKRRDVIKNLSILPMSGVVLGSAMPLGSVLGSSVSEPPAAPKRDLIKELGLRKFINAAGTYTFMSGSLMHDEVVEAIRACSKEFVLIDDVQDKAGEKIAAICHAEAATVTAGCWSALVLGTAGVITGMDPKKVAQLPNVEGMKSEILVQKTHNHGYVHALTNTGAKIVEIETAEELDKAVNDKTAMMWFLNYCANDGKISDKEWVALGKKHKIPTMIDMAADVPPVSNLWKFNDMGFDLVCVSGGKDLRGPQSAGILMGKKELIAAARLNAPPRGGNIGRGMKVNKEEILGMYVALEKFVSIDHEKEMQMWKEQIAVIESAIKNIKGVTTNVSIPPIANQTPTLNFFWDKNIIKLTREEFQDRLRKGDPSIEVIGGKDESINITAWMLKPGQEKIVASRVQEVLSKGV